MKEKIIKKIIINLIILGIIVGLNNTCFAANTTNETSNTQATSKSETSKSNNANLKILGIKPYDFTGFRYGTTNYNVTVPESTKSVEVYAEAQDSKAKLTGTGTKTLDSDKTKADVVVTAEDGTKKTYTINITKGEVKEENTTSKTNTTTTISNTNNKNTNTNTEEKSNGLSSLKINELTLMPDFKTGVYEYSVKYIGKAAKLDIKAEPTNAEYIVEIIGNTDLKEGENIITILVSDKNGENIATYQITVNKSLKDENASNSEFYLIIAGIIGVILVIIIIVFLVKRKKNEEYDYEYEEDEEEEKNDSQSIVEKNGKNKVINKQEDEGELPKALRNKHKFESKYDYEEITKEDARKNFLEGYNNDNYKDERSSNKHKGKRFK